MKSGALFARTYLALKKQKSGQNEAVEKEKKKDESLLYSQSLKNFWSGVESTAIIYDKVKAAKKRQTVFTRNDNSTENSIIATMHSRRVYIIIYIILYYF